MTALYTVLQIALVLFSISVIFLVLLHKGSGGGLSDMFGGGTGANLGGSSRAERNLNRITVVMVSLWFFVIVLMGVADRFRH